MNPFRRFWRARSLQGKLLIFAGSTITCVIALTLFTHIQAYQSMAVFNRNLNRYYDIDSLRRSVMEADEFLDRYLRTGNEEFLDSFDRRIASAYREFHSVSDNESFPFPARFEVNAIQFGLAEWERRASAAVAEFRRGEEGYYSSYTRARRISDYVSSYVANLLHIQLWEGRQEYALVMAEADRHRLLSLAGVALMGLLFYGFGVLFSRSIATPIHKLADASERMAGGMLDVESVDVTGKDEIAILADAFNRMSSSIHGLVRGMEEKAEVEKQLHAQELKNSAMSVELQRASFLGLQAQIHPHFLFNTLNTILRTAMFERASQTSSLIHALSEIFRYNLCDPDALLGLDRELSVVEQYLSIQKHRYRSRLSYTINRVVDCSNIRVPPFILQPLVENAVRHGIEPDEEGGSVTISVHEENGLIAISVADSGVGIPADRLAALRGEIARSCCGSSDGGPMHLEARDDGGSGIGVVNVALRLHLFFGERTGLSIASEPGSGTEVHIHFPSVATDEGKVHAI